MSQTLCIPEPSNGVVVLTRPGQQYIVFHTTTVVVNVQTYTAPTAGVLAAAAPAYTNPVTVYLPAYGVDQGAVVTVAVATTSTSPAQIAVLVPGYQARRSVPASAVVTTYHVYPGGTAQLVYASGAWLPVVLPLSSKGYGSPLTAPASLLINYLQNLPEEHTILELQFPTGTSGLQTQNVVKGTLGSTYATGVSYTQSLPTVPESPAYLNGIFKLFDKATGNYFYLGGALVSTSPPTLNLASAKLSALKTVTLRNNTGVDLVFTGSVQLLGTVPGSFGNNLQQQNSVLDGLSNAVAGSITTYSDPLTLSTTLAQPGGLFDVSSVFQLEVESLLEPVYLDTVITYGSDVITETYLAQPASTILNGFLMDIPMAQIFVSNSVNLPPTGFVLTSIKFGETLSKITSANYQTDRPATGGFTYATDLLFDNLPVVIPTLPVQLNFETNTGMMCTALGRVSDVGPSGVNLFSLPLTQANITEAYPWNLQNGEIQSLIGTGALLIVFSNFPITYFGEVPSNACSSFTSQNGYMAFNQPIPVIGPSDAIIVYLNYSVDPNITPPPPPIPPIPALLTQITPTNASISSVNRIGGLTNVTFINNDGVAGGIDIKGIYYPATGQSVYFTTPVTVYDPVNVDRIEFGTSYPNNTLTVNNVQDTTFKLIAAYTTGGSDFNSPCTIVYNLSPYDTYSCQIHDYSSGTQAYVNMDNMTITVDPLP
jgi:hypothetical protein